MLLSSKKRHNEYKENGQQYIPVTDDTIVSEEAQLISIDNDDYYYDGSPSKTHIEGSKKQITINTFERNNYARKMCIAYHKPKCYICSFDFEKVYGIEFKGKIHVHHIKALYEIDDEYEVNPINDLIPVCPNCHYVLHSKRPPYKPYELINIIRENKKS
jgi:predicted HNH restriction endonuclease